MPPSGDLEFSRKPLSGVSGHRLPGAPPPAGPPGLPHAPGARPWPYSFAHPKSPPEFQSPLLPLTAPPPAPPALTVPHLLGDLWQSEVEFSPPISVTLTKATLSDIPLFFVVLAKQFFHFFPTMLSAYVPGVIRIQQRTQKNTVSLQSLCSFDDHGRLCYRVSLACLAPFSLWISSLQGGSLVTSTEAYAMLFHR